VGEVHLGKKVNRREREKTIPERLVSFAQHKRHI